MKIKDKILYIKTTQKKHDSGFNIIKAYMDGKYLSNSSDAIALHLKGGEYRIDSDEYGNVRIYPWCNYEDRVFVTDAPKDTSTIIIREGGKVTMAEKEERILIARSTDYTISDTDKGALFEGKIEPHCANVFTRQEAINRMAKTNALELIKKHLQKKHSITSWDAITKYGCTRLSGVIYKLKQEGWKIETESITKKNRYGITVTFAKYKLKK